MKKNKALRVLFITVASVISFILLLLGGVKAGEKIAFAGFYANATKEFKMPGSNDGLVQQGFVYVEEKEVFLACGYMNDDSASRVYVVDKNGKVLSYSQLKKADGSDYTGHAGGIEYYEDYVYITESSRSKGTGGGVDVFPLNEILNGQQAVTCLGRSLTYNTPSCCHIYNGYMFLGEFYRAGDYETPDEHHITTPAGDQNTSVMTVFKLGDKDVNFGLSEQPVASISCPGAVQGMITINDSKIVLSTSWGLSTSKLYVYDMSKITHNTSETLGTEVYYLDSASLAEVIDAPPMAEEMVYLDGKIYILNESASNKYIFGKFMSGNYVYAYDVAE